MEYLFSDCNIRKVTGGTLKPNIGMINVMERSGMELEAVRKQQQIFDGEAQDVLCFSKFSSN